MLKWAVSRDGMVAGRAGRPRRITGAVADRAIQELRGRCDAIAVGTNTLINDDPRLTARGQTPPRRPLRVVFSNSLKLPEVRRLWEDGPPVVVYANDETLGDSLPDNVEVVRLPAVDNGRGGRRFSMSDALRDLHRRGVVNLLIESGPKLAADLLHHRLADAAWVLTSTSFKIGDDGLEAPSCDWPVSQEVRLGDDVLREHLRPGVPVSPTPDVRLAAALAAAGGEG